MNGESLVVADIGGTNTRLARVDGDHLGGVERYRNDEADAFEDCLADFLARHAVEPACTDCLLAVAAPVAGDPLTLTNLDWRLSSAAIEQDFGFRRVSLLNDFEALGWALPCLDAADLVELGGGRAMAGAPCLVLGPGTGFGAAVWLPHGEVLASEAGHALASASTLEEARILAMVRERLGPVSVEQVLSGPGIENLHTALGGEAMAAAAITAAALAGDNPVAVETLALFFAFLGLAARNLALGCGARGGVYLAGGILPRLGAQLRASRFRERFETPAPLPGYLEAIPTRLIIHPEPALLGLMHYGRRRAEQS